MAELLVGLPEVNVLGVDDVADGPVRVYVECRGPLRCCPECGTPGGVKDRPLVELVDLPAFGRRVRLVWGKHRWWCRSRECAIGSWTGEDHRIAAPRLGLPDRAGRWATRQVGRLGRTVAEVARELGCDWHTVNQAVIAYGTALVDDPARVGEVTTLGLDETLFCRQGRWRTQQWCTSIVKAEPSATQLLDVVAGRNATGPSNWLENRPPEWRERIRWGVLDLSGPYRKTFDETLSHVTQIADPFHLVRLANQKLDECRRRVQNQTVGHRGRKHDPRYRARRLLTKAHERLDPHGEDKLMGLLRAGDPHGEVRTARHAKQVVRSIYQITDPDLAAEFVTQLGQDLQDPSCPPEVRSLGRTIVRWNNQIIAWHRAVASNRPTEAVNNLIKRIRRIGFGFRRFHHHRIRVLLHAGRPNWNLLATITPRRNPMSRKSPTCTDC